MMGRPTGTFLLPQTFLLTGQFLTDVRKGFGPINFPQSGAGSGVRGPGSGIRESNLGGGETFRLGRTQPPKQWVLGPSRE